MGFTKIAKNYLKLINKMFHYIFTLSVSTILIQKNNYFNASLIKLCDTGISITAKPAEN